MNEIEKIEVYMDQEEINEKIQFVKNIVKKDMKKYNIGMNNPNHPVIVDVFNAKDDEKSHMGMTEIKLVEYFTIDTKKLCYRKIKGFNVKFHPFPSLLCLERIAHHETGHIINWIRNGPSREEHDVVFNQIVNSLDKNINLDICKLCPYHHKLIIFRKGDDKK